MTRRRLASTNIAIGNAQLVGLRRLGVVAILDFVSKPSQAVANVAIAICMASMTIPRIQSDAKSLYIVIPRNEVGHYLVQLLLASLSQ